MYLFGFFRRIQYSKKQPPDTFLISDSCFIIFHPAAFLLWQARSFHRPDHLLQTIEDHTLSTVSSLPNQYIPSINDTISFFISLNTKFEMLGKSRMVKNIIKNPIRIFICIPMANMFICGATFAIIPKMQFSIIITAKIGKMIRNAITNRSVI